VLVIDLGGQYSQLIARRVRECRVYSELVGHTISPEAVRARNPYALILSGGPASVYADDAPHVDPRIFELGIPTLGICYGMQLMALELGGRVDRTGVSEFGKTELHTEESRLLKDTPTEQTVWMSHRDSVVAPPEGSRVVAGSPSTPIGAFEAPDRKLYGVQFHPEVVHTPHGMQVLKNFLYDIADAPPCPILLAALAPKMLELAGAVADGTITWMTGPATLADHTIPVITAAARAAGRPAPRVCASLPVCVTDDPAAARARAADEFAVYGMLPSYRAMLDREGAAGPADVAIVGDAATVTGAVHHLAEIGVTDFAPALFGSRTDRNATREVLAGLV